MMALYTMYALSYLVIASHLRVTLERDLLHANSKQDILGFLPFGDFLKDLNTSTSFSNYLIASLFVGSP